MLPTIRQTGFLYAGMGYTLVIDAAIALPAAGLAHLELADLPIIDAGFLVLSGNEWPLLEAVRGLETNLVRDLIGWRLDRAGAWGLKVVDPGGIESWKSGHAYPTELDDQVARFGITPRQLLVPLARAIEELRIPHPMHLHGLKLGLPGSASTTLEVLQALDGHRLHLAHIQFHSYGSEGAGPGGFTSGVEQLAEYLNTHSSVTVDVGQVVFGPTLAMTADSGVGQYLASLTSRPWVSHDVEFETGCGVLPVEYETRRFVHALQWAIGLEWFLRMQDPWRITLTTDHPNGGSFLAYPDLMACLMNRDLRREQLAQLPARAREATTLGELDREYTLNEIVTITRAAPARILGLEDRGHLGPGAIADVAIHRPDTDRRRMFARPRWVIKSGRVVIDDGHILDDRPGRTLSCLPGYDPSVERYVAKTAPATTVTSQWGSHPAQRAARPIDFRRCFDS
jgi:formylmethanofuran dehydrogenase subunit A